MLKLETPTGSVELSAAQERAVRSMTDADVCRALNRGGDPFVFAALKERPQIQLHPSAGWIYGSSSEAPHDHPNDHDAHPYRA